MNLGKVVSIKKVINLALSNRPPLNGSNGSQLGVRGMLNFLCGGDSYDGYQVKTDEHAYLILIENGQSCCESWGYFSSDDNLTDYIGKTLEDVVLTDTALNSKRLEKEIGIYGLDEGGIQFVDFAFSDGEKLQLTVYNEHNGYYGHSIIVAKDDEILLSDTL